MALNGTNRVFCHINVLSLDRPSLAQGYFHWPLIRVYFPLLAKYCPRARTKECWTLAGTVKIGSGNRVSSVSMEMVSDDNCVDHLAYHGRLTQMPMTAKSGLLLLYIRCGCWTFWLRSSSPPQSAARLAGWRWQISGVLVY